MKKYLIFLLLFIASPSYAASCFWVGGTGLLTPTNTASWSSSSGGTGGTCAAAGGIPASSSDTATWDGNSGGGTTTLNFGGTWTVGSIVFGNFAGTWDNSVNNNNVIMTLSGTALNGSGTAIRTYNFGTATYTLSGTNAIMTFATTSNLTLNASLSTIVFSGNGQRQYIHGGATLGTLNIGASSGSGYFKFVFASGIGPTIGTVNITAPNYLIFASGVSYTITNAVSWIGTSSAAIGLATDTVGSTSSIAFANSSNMSWTAIRDIIATSGSPIATNSFNEGGNSGFTITGPTAGGGGSNSFGFGFK